MYADHYVADEMSFRAREDRLAAQEERMYCQLKREYIDALLTKPLAVVPTPAFRDSRYTAADLVADYENAGNDIANLLRLCDKAGDPAIRIAAQAILSKAADEYAKTHAEASL